MPSPIQSRREFLNASLALTSAAVAGCVSTHPDSDRAVIDTHTHFYDPTRPQGVPWPDKNDRVLYRTVLPSDYRTLGDRLGVTGTVVVEASSWVEDNQWILDLAQNDPFIIGFVGNLKPGQPEFRSHLARFAKNRLYRGIRIGGGDLKRAVQRPEVLDDLKRLSDRDLSLDVLIGPDALADVVELAGRVPDLRIIVDHCANVPINEAPLPAAWVDGIVACHYKPNVFMKVSGLVEGTGRTHGDAPSGVQPYRRVLDTIWGSFGEDRVIYGSNWPVSERFAPLATVQSVVTTYFHEKGEVTSEKYFRRNAARVYKTVRR